jgi:HEAT repeat protein
MAKLRFSFGSIALLAITFSAAGQAALLAANDWDAKELAQPFPAAATEEELIEQLRTATPEGKAMACKQLSIYGTKAAVPELAKLLSDEQMSSWSRIALEAIPDPTADAALIEAAGKLNGKLLVGVINSIGAKRSDDSIEQLTKRLSDNDEQVAAAAAVALGKIGNEHSIGENRQ